MTGATSHPTYRHRAQSIDDGLRRWRLPDYMHHEIRAYLLTGLPTGDFLWYILTNDGAGSAGMADALNLEALGRWFAFLVGCAPSAAWRSSEAIDAWIAHRGLVGLIERELAERDDRLPIHPSEVLP